MRSTASGSPVSAAWLTMARTAYHHAVDAHGHAGARHDEVAHAETLGGHGDLLAVLEAPGVLGNGHEGANEFVL